MILVFILAVTVYGAFWHLLVLELTAAIFNLCMWLWFVAYALHTLRGIWASRHAIEDPHVVPLKPMKSPSGHDQIDLEAACLSIVHVIVLPNYKEDEAIMAATLDSLREAHGSHDFRVILAMEDREGPVAAERARRLEERFASSFAKVSITFHPGDLKEDHLDGTVIPEIPGKASNLKWAVRHGYEECEDDGINPSAVIITVADADCIFHPFYFAEVSREFGELRAAPGSQHQWTIWQAPQLPFRNYFASPAPSRIWGYIASCIEFGGVSGLAFGGFHMTFSSFSLPLELVMKAKPWDGDVIADDHHCYLKCFLYAIHNQACQQMQMEGGCTGVNPPLQVRPVMLPVKTTSVAAESCLKSWKSRFNQAQRHTQGVAELSYILLGIWDLFRTLPRSAYTFTLFSKLCRVALVPLAINMLSICQAIPFAAMAVYWLLNNREMPNCPNEIWLQLDRPQFYLCVLAGGWNLVVPMIIPMVLLVAASYSMISVFFLLPRESGKSDTLWRREDGDIPPVGGSKRLSLFGLILIDVLFLTPAVMPIYGLIPNARSYWNVMVRGNQFKFVSAAKGVGTPTPFIEVEGEAVQSPKPNLSEIMGKPCNTVRNTGNMSQSDS